MTNEPASPVCYAAEGGDTYMGFASREELLTELNQLLEAERAGARVGRASVRSAPDQCHAELMKAVGVDEARWCAMLSRRIRRLGGVPSRAVGDFHPKALAIADPIERLAFLNRGQAWVVRKLEALTPRVREDGLHKDLRVMLDSHRTNIDLAAALLDQVRGAGQETRGGEGFDDRS